MVINPHNFFTLMTYTPTKEELEELGFTDYNNEGFFYRKGNKILHLYHKKVGHYSIEFIPHHKVKPFQIVNEANNVDIYPQSLDDIKTLIRILTPQ